MAIGKSDIERAYGDVFVGGNTYELFSDARKGFEAILDGVQKAEKTIDLSFYIFRNDATGGALAKLLQEKAAKGVEIRLLYDNFASWRTPERFWRALRKSGIQTLSAHPFNWRNPLHYIHRDHRKLVVIDEGTVFVGGVNMHTRALTNRDTVFRMDGPIASSFQQIFNVTWMKWGGAALFHSATRAIARRKGVPMMPVCSYSGRARSRIIHLLSWAIAHASHSIYITTPFFVPTPHMTSLLIEAARRGVKVKILLPMNNEIFVAGIVAVASFGLLEENQVEVFLYKTHMLHAKTYVFDEVLSVVGSVNLDYQSLVENDESNVAVYDKECAKTFIGAFHDDLRHAQAVTLKMWFSRSFWERFWEWFLSHVRTHL